MMHEDVERVLRCYRAGEPTPGLRERVLAGARPDRRVILDTVDYALVAAAAVLLVAWAAVETPAPARVETAAEVSRRTAIEQLAGDLGGDAMARRLAELAVPPVEAVTAPSLAEQP
jgi:hypothetical protein